MKKFISYLLCLTMVFVLVGNITAFAQTGRVSYFAENIIEGHTTNNVTTSKDLFVYKNNTNGNDGQITVTALNHNNVYDYDAEVVNVNDIASTYADVAKGAVGTNLIKYTQGAGIGMLRLQNWLPARTYTAGEVVKIGMRVFLTDTYENTAATTTSDVSKIRTRLMFCVGTASKEAITSNQMDDIATNQWVTISRMVTLTEDYANILNSGNVGMRFDFAGQSGNTSGIADKAYAGTVFFDDVFFLEVTDAESTELVEGSVNEHTSNDVTKTKDLFVYKNDTDGNDGQITVTALNHNNVIDYDAELVNVGDIETEYPEVAKGSNGRKLIKYTQGAGIGMLRLQNWAAPRTYTAGETVKISMRVFLTDTYANTAATEQSAVENLKTRLIFCVGTGGKDAITSNKMENIPTNEWVTVSREVTLTADHANTLNSGNVGMRFDFAGQSGNTEGIADKAYAGTVFFDDEFSIEVAGNYTDDFTSWAQAIDSGNGSLFLDKGGDAANGRITFTSAGAPTQMEGLAFPKASYKKVTVEDIKDTYENVATGYNDADHLIRVTQNGNMFMNRMTNAVAQGTFKEGEVVEVSFNVFLADPKSAAATTSAPATADDSIESFTGRISLRNDKSDVAHANVEIPVGKWTTVTKQFRITSDQTAVHGFRFDFNGEAMTSKFNTPFAGTMFFDGNWSLKKVTNIHNTSEHTMTIDAEANTITLAFKGTNVRTDNTMGIAAAFDGDGKFLGAQIIDIVYGDDTYANNTISVEDVTKVSDVKLFLFDENLKPLQTVSNFCQSID